VTSADTDRGPTRPARVLIVEDERHTARLLQFILEKHHYSVQVAYDGEAALVAAAQYRPDAVLLDLQLPKASGVQVLQRIRSDPQFTGLVVMVLSARSFESNPEEIVRAGANAHGTKPIAPSTLLEKLKQLGIPPEVPDADRAS
jgi:DNA-binding response OmpR family regulator